MSGPVVAALVISALVVGVVALTNYLAYITGRVVGRTNAVVERVARLIDE